MHDQAGRDHVHTILAFIAEASKKVLPESLYDTFQDIEAADIRQKRIDSGDCLMHPEKASVNETGARKYAGDLLDGLSRTMAEYHVDISNLKKSLQGNEARILSDLILTNRAEDLAAFARSCGVSLDVLSFFAVYFARPYRREAAARLTRNLDMSRWPMGFCPVCGHAPCFARLAGRSGKRTLWCHACCSQWSFERLRCPFCLNDDHDKLKYFILNDDETYRIDVCNNCRKYIKTRRSTGQPSDRNAESIEIERDYLDTPHLDYVAASEGYARESVLCAHRDSTGGQEAWPSRAKARPGRPPE